MFLHVKLMVLMVANGISKLWASNGSLPFVAIPEGRVFSQKLFWLFFLTSNGHCSSSSQRICMNNWGNYQWVPLFPVEASKHDSGHFSANVLAKKRRLRPKKSSGNHIFKMFVNGFKTVLTNFPMLLNDIPTFLNHIQMFWNWFFNVFTHFSIFFKLVDEFCRISNVFWTKTNSTELVNA